MNFIIDFFFSKLNEFVFDFILIVVNRYIKYVRYIFSRKDWDAKRLTNVILNEIFTKFDLSKLIINDRESLFIAHYWSNFCYYLQMKLKYNIAFHFQIDDQTKRQNQTLKQYLRCYINYQQNDWMKWLNLAEFAYNNNCHEMTKIFFFQIIYEKNSQWKNQIVEKRNKVISAIKKKQNEQCIYKINWSKNSKMQQLHKHVIMIKSICRRIIAQKIKFCWIQKTLHQIDLLKS